MTNGEKYLKDGVDIKDIENDFKMYLDGRLPYTDVTDWVKLRQFLLEPVKPTLTEDEKVILRNIDKKFKDIKRKEDNILYLVEEVDSIHDVRYEFNFFSSLFQFIKERRRI